MIAFLLAFVLGVNHHAAPGVLALDHDGQPLTRAYICSVRWGLDARHVTEAMKRSVAGESGIPRASIVARGRGPCCEFDHVIPRELGGADAVANLQLQPWIIAHRKDVDENRFHRAVCAGTMDLEAAQEAMRQWGH